MKLIRFLKGVLRTRQANAQRSSLLSAAPMESVDPENFASSLQKPTDYYRRSFQDFHRVLPQELRDHRAWFTAERRGFGEDAFHTMWWRLVKRFRPSNFLEIGVYRGQTLSLISLLARLENIDCPVTGISPFSSAGDSVSKYGQGLDYKADTLANFSRFHLPEPTLHQAYSTDASAVELIRSRPWSLIYIDGNHDYEIVKADWNVCAASLAPGGLIVLDDSGLSTAYEPPAFATGGHPGPSKLATEIDRGQFEEILQVGHNRVFRKIAG